MALDHNSCESSVNVISSLAGTANFVNLSEKIANVFVILPEIAEFTKIGREHHFTT